MMGACLLLLSQQCPYSPNCAAQHEHHANQRAQRARHWAPEDRLLALQISATMSAM